MNIFKRLFRNKEIDALKKDCDILKNAYKDIINDNIKTEELLRQRGKDFESVENKYHKALQTIEFLREKEQEFICMVDKLENEVKQFKKTNQKLVKDIQTLKGFETLSNGDVVQVRKTVKPNKTL
jgi:uncharacterized protein YifE (UPF0438 family)